LEQKLRLVHRSSLDQMKKAAWTDFLMQRLTQVRNARQETNATVVQVAKDMFGNEPGLLESILNSLKTAYDFVVSIPGKVLNAVCEILD